MDFVDDEDLVAVAHRRDRERLDDDLADGVDAGVGRAVDLEDVDVAALGNFRARVALAARLPRSARSRNSAPAPESSRSSSSPRRAGPQR